MTMKSNQQEHSVTKIHTFLEESTTNKPMPNRATIDVVRFMMNVTKYLTDHEHRIYYAGYNKGREFQRKLSERKKK